MRMTKKQILELRSKQEEMTKQILKVLCGDNFIKSLDIRVTEDGLDVSFTTLQKDKIQ